MICRRSNVQDPLHRPLGRKAKTKKTEADAENGKLTTGTNVNCDLDDKIIRQIEVLKHFTFANDVLINFVYYSLVLFWRL